MENGHLVHLKWTWEVQAKLNTMVEKYISHQQKVKLVSENGPHPPILLQIVHKYFELFILNLPPCFKGFNDVITSTRYLITCFVTLANSLHSFLPHWASRLQSF
jgi:hypothetical protein